MSPTPHYYAVAGRAAEIARTSGSPGAGPEHLFLAMLHDGGWPVSAISDLVDLDRAEAAVHGILDSPGYSLPAPPLPRPLVPSGYARAADVRVAVEMGGSHLGLEHMFLAMIRDRETVPACCGSAAGTAGPRRSQRVRAGRAQPVPQHEGRCTGIPVLAVAELASIQAYCSHGTTLTTAGARDSGEGSAGSPGEGRSRR